METTFDKTIFAQFSNEDCTSKHVTKSVLNKIQDCRANLLTPTKDLVNNVSLPFNPTSERLKGNRS